MSETTHQWKMFSKGRMRVEACENCGDLHLASNTNYPCSETELSESQIVKAGYRCLSNIESPIETAA